MNSTDPSTGLDPVLSIAKAAEALSLSKRTIWALASEKKLTITKVSARRRGIRVSEINRYRNALNGAPVAG